MSASFRKPCHAEEAYRRLAIIVALVTLSKDLLGKPLGHIWTKASPLGIYGRRQAAAADSCRRGHIWTKSRSEGFYRRDL